MTAATGSHPRPAFYAARSGRAGDWWTLLHPPYTAWHLSYVVVGASLAPHATVGRLLATLAAFFLAVGLAAHALDELNGRPLGTRISTAALVVTTAVGLGGAVALGVAGLSRVGWVLVPFLVIGPVLVLAYDLELFGGLLHNDVGFALAWGSFPLLVGYVAESRTLAPSALVAAGAAFALSLAQRRLSTPARTLRRRVADVEGRVTHRDGSVTALDRRALLAPLEGALRALSWAVVLVAAALAVARFT